VSVGHCGKLSLLGVLQARHFMINFFPCDAKDSKKTTVKKISSNITKTKFIYKTKVSTPEVEAGSPMHLLALIAQLQASQFPRRRPVQPLELPQRVLAPPALGKPGGSWLRKHISTCSTTASARMRPSTSSRLLMTSSSSDILTPAESSSGSSVLASCVRTPDRRGLKPKGTSADSDWPRKSQTFYASLARTAWRSSSLF
jgi:hypothetical protein